jgi:hypothetical protein
MMLKSLAGVAMAGDACGVAHVLHIGADIAVTAGECAARILVFL